MSRSKRATAIIVISVVLFLCAFGMEKPYPVKAAGMGVTYSLYIQKDGDKQGYVSNGKRAGTIGQSKRAENIKIKLTGTEYTGSIKYRTYIQKLGWTDWVKDGAMSGTKGRSLRLEAIQIKLEGDVAEHYDVCYVAHVKGNGWQAWRMNGGTAGTQGQSTYIDAIQIKLKAKDDYTYTQDMIDIVNRCNKERKAAGVDNNLVLDSELCKTAEIRAKELSSYFSHTRPDGRACFTVLTDCSVRYLIAAENIAYGQTTADEVMNSWMKSAENKKKVLNKTYNRLGVASYTQGQTIYWIQLFTD